MVKRKASGPQRIATDEDRRARSWNLNDAHHLQHHQQPDDGLQSSSSSSLMDVLDDEHSDTGQKELPNVSPTGDSGHPELPSLQSSTGVNSAKITKNKKPKVIDPLAHLHEDMQIALRKCEFRLDVLPPSVDAPEVSIGKLGKLHFRLCTRGGRVQPRPRDMFKSSTSGFSIYADRCQSNVYCELGHRDVPFIGDCLDVSRSICLAVWQDASRDQDYSVLHALRGKQFARLQLLLPDDDHENADGRFQLDVYLMKCSLVKLPYWSVVSKSRDHNDFLTVMTYFCGVVAPKTGVTLEENTAEDCRVDNVYDAVKSHHAQEAQPDVQQDVQHPDLVPKLRPYQVDAVQWMLRRECPDDSAPMTSAKNVSCDSHPLFVEVQLNEDGPFLFVNPYGAYVTDQKPVAGEYSPGGILADEMGLGKTVEVLAAILCHPRPEKVIPIFDQHGNYGDFLLKSDKRKKAFFECICGHVDEVKPTADCMKERVQCEKCGLWQHASCVNYNLEDDTTYYCPHCWIRMPPIPSRATLIVSPPIIIQQWLDDIKKHVKRDSLKILTYEGVYSAGFIQPPTLADQDIVIMSYATMRKEIDYVDLPHSNSDQGRRLRHPKRFMALPSPLVAVEWWRVCLDEAQMVECCARKTAEMALKLRAINRWCITGTPIQKSVNDLYGLVLFLRVDPYFLRTWWNECLAKPYFNKHVEPLHKAIATVMWRTAKKDVLDQIGIPPQTEEVNWLSFTPVEEHFYRQLHIYCSQELIAKLKTFKGLDQKLESVDHSLLNNWMLTLLHLRKACCHPQTVRGKFLKINKGIMTMEELLDDLMNKATLECEEQNRHLVIALNGLAGIDIIKEEWSDAVEKYREVLKSDIRTDKLPKLHALNNLAELLDAVHEGISATEDEAANLRQQSKDLQDAYLAKYLNKVRESHQVLQLAVSTVDETTSEFTCDKLPWWAAVLKWAASDPKLEKDVISRVKSDMANFSTGSATIHNCIRFRDSTGLRFLITRQLSKLHESRLSLSKAIKAFKESPSAEDINCAVECHLRPGPTNRERPKKKCTYCDVHELFNRYESELFMFEKYKQTDEAADATRTLRRGTWACGEIEQILRGVLSFLRLQEHTVSKKNQGVLKTWLEDGNTEMKLFEALKKEFKGFRGVWMQFMDQVAALDELSMANTRLRVTLTGEEPQLAIISRHEVDTQKFKLKSDLIVAQNQLKKMKGQLHYLQRLANSGYGKRGGSNPDLCPICQQVLGNTWCVLQCGHCFCEECIRIIAMKNGLHLRFGSIKCPVCRYVTTADEVSHVSTKIENPQEQEDNVVEVVGSHSIKVEAILKKLLRIRQDEPSSKTLVFSMWQNVLDLLGKALKQNDLRFCSLTMRNKIQESLTLFKEDPYVSILLLPFKSGSNGLNLIEATHVILVEPTLDPAIELQAIGRVHRIGQTKPTVVHRFLIRTTIEEHMHNVLAKVRNTWNASSHDTEENPTTVANLVEIVTLAAQQTYETDENDD